MLDSRGLDRPLEFGTVHLKMPYYIYSTVIDTLTYLDMFNQAWVKVTYENGNMYITTNYRYYLAIKKVYPDIDEYFTEEDNKYYPKRYTVHMILDRGVMDEFRTHVGLSHLAESTRYCNYSKDKFGNELTFIKPCWLNDEKLKLYGPYHTVIRDKSPESIFIANLNNVERDYLDLIKLGWTPQQARSVLPLGIKSELISCGFEDAWENFFKRRDAPDAHTMAQEIANPMHQKFIELTKIG